MQLEIFYVSTFTYPAPARESHNLLRACPSSDHRQRLLDYQLEIDPPARPFFFFDYWGTRVDAFGVREPHSRLTVEARSTVETSEWPPPPKGASADPLSDPVFREEHHEYLQPSPHARWGEEIAEWASGQASPGGDDVTARVLAVHQAVGEKLDYAPGTTYVGVDVNQVFHAAQGVCQDFVHLALACYRSQGIPARYASGYLFAAPDTGEAPEGPPQRVHTHAWVEVAVPGYGWWALDPTNGKEVGLRHVKIGHGRDYDDVLPLRGTYSGPDQHYLEVSVHVDQTAAAQQ